MTKFAPAHRRLPCSLNCVFKREGGGRGRGEEREKNRKYREGYAR